MEKKSRQSDQSSAVRCQLSDVVKPRRGFTLLEFLLYFALLGIVMSVVIGFSLDVLRTRAKGRAVVEVEQNVRFGMMRMLRTVRQAAQLNVGASTFDSDNGVLSLAQAAAAADPTVFDLSGGVLRIKEGSASATPLTSSDVTVTKLRFAKDNLGGNNNAVTVELTAQFNTANPGVEFNYATSASGTAVIRKQ